MKLFGSRVLVLPNEPENVTEGGIVIPDSVKSRPNDGVVILVGPADEDPPTNVQIGDRVAYPPRCGTAIDYQGKEHFIIRKSDLFCQL